MSRSFQRFHFQLQMADAMFAVAMRRSAKELSRKNIRNKEACESEYERRKLKGGIKRDGYALSDWY
jgi:hypothetical protein